MTAVGGTATSCPAGVALEGLVTHIYICIMGDYYTVVCLAGVNEICGSISNLDSTQNFPILYRPVICHVDMNCLYGTEALVNIKLFTRKVRGLGEDDQFCEHIALGKEN